MGQKTSNDYQAYRAGKKAIDLQHFLDKQRGTTAPYWEELDFVRARLKALNRKFNRDTRGTFIYEPINTPRGWGR